MFLGVSGEGVGQTQMNLRPVLSAQRAVRPVCKYRIQLCLYRQVFA